MYYGRSEDKLFRTTGWHKWSENIIAGAHQKASDLEKSVFEANSQEKIVDYIMSGYNLASLELLADNKTQDIVGTKIDVSSNGMYASHFDDGPASTPGYNVTVIVPFTGSSELFGVSPTSMRLTYDEASVTEGKLTFTLEFTESNATAESIKSAVDKRIADIQHNVDNLNKDLSGFDARVRNVVIDAVANRFKQINKLDSIKTALQIPLEKSANPSPLNQVKISVQKISPLSTKNDEPGGTISSDDYEAIIETVRSMGASMETNRASETKDEEALRDILLVGLSASIKSGTVGGELFHKSGKTDISIPFDNKATFVAECKLWKGQKYIGEGVDQLLGYLTWRDAKTALIIFNKDNSNFSDIQSKIEAIFTERSDYVRTIKQRDGEWRFVMTKPDDSGRQIEIHTMLFDVYEAKTWHYQNRTIRDSCDTWSGHGQKAWS